MEPSKSVYVDIGGLDKELDGNLWESEDNEANKSDCQRMEKSCGHSSSGKEYLRKRGC